MTQEVSVKRRISEWWSAHPMDYTVEFGPEGLSREQFEAIDMDFRIAHDFAQRSGEPLFASFVDYPRLKDQTVLEIGCGMGSMSGAFSEAGARIVALDISRTAVRQTSHRANLFRFEVDVVQSDAENLPFREGSFAYVWSWGVIHHSPGTKKTVSEIHRVVREGGETMVMVYNRNSIFHVMYLFMVKGILQMRLLRQDIQGIRNAYSDGAEVGGNLWTAYYSAKEFLSFFSGFSRRRVLIRGQKTELIPFSRIGLLGTARRLIPESIYRLVLGRLGMFLVVQAKK